MRPALCLILLSAGILSSGCATPYQPIGFAGGYSETQLAPDMFRIAFAGNGYTSGERAQDFALLRAADLCIEHSFKHFAIVNESNSNEVSSFTTPGHADTTGSAYIYGNQATYSGYTTYTPPQTYFISRPHAGLLVRCFTEKPEGVYAFDAEFLQQSIREKYKVK
jgi:hypothetical protein